jgi:hypothetical protein
METAYIDLHFIPKGKTPARVEVLSTTKKPKHGGVILFIFDNNVFFPLKN